MHIVYQTTNLVNGKIYVGVCNSDKTYSKYYLGSGIGIKRAIKKYGYENFERRTLFNCDDSKEAYWLETIVVNEWFVQQKWNYNMVVGGKGGNFGKEVNRKISEKRKGCKLSKKQIELLRERNKGNTYMLGKRHSKESKRKMSESKKGMGGRSVIMISKRGEQMLIFDSIRLATRFVNLKSESGICEVLAGRNKESGKLLLNGKLTKFKWKYAS